jgi:cobalamin biosynthesis Mg chelatase CobN
MKEQFIQDFDSYVTSLSRYLIEVENRLFSEGLHEFGMELTASQVMGYLNALNDDEQVDSLSRISNQKTPYLWH